MRCRLAVRFIQSFAKIRHKTATKSAYVVEMCDNIYSKNSYQEKQLFFPILKSQSLSAVYIDDVSRIVKQVFGLTQHAITLDILRLPQFCFNQNNFITILKTFVLLYRGILQINSFPAFARRKCPVQQQIYTFQIHFVSFCSSCIFST